MPLNFQDKGKSTSCTYTVESLRNRESFVVLMIKETCMSMRTGKKEMKVHKIRIRIVFTFGWVDTGLTGRGHTGNYSNDRNLLYFELSGDYKSMCTFLN